MSALIRRDDVAFDPSSGSDWSLFCKRWALVAFVPPEDQLVRDWLSLRKHFAKIEILESYASPRKTPGLLRMNAEFGIAGRNPIRNVNP